MTGALESRARPAPAKIRWELFGAQEFDRHLEQWDELNEAASGPPALAAGFIATLLKEFGTGRELLAVGCHGTTLQAITLLYRKNIGFWETFQPAQAPLGAWINRPPGTLASLAPGLLSTLPGFAVAIGITQQDPELVPRPAENAAVETLDYIETARVTVAGTFDEYWAKRGKNLRNNTKKQRNRLEKDGVALHLDTITDAADVARAIDDYGRLESSGWKASTGSAIHPSNAQGRFYRAMLEAFCRRGAARIYRYRYGDSIVAMDLCIKNDRTLVVLKTTYDESIRDSSPASLMRHEYFRNIFDEAKVRRIEFYGKVMDWHTKWSDEIRVLYHANFYRSAAALRARRILRRPPLAGPAQTALSLPATELATTTAVPAPSPAGPAFSAETASQQDAYKWQFFPATEFNKYAPAWQAIVADQPNSPIVDASFINSLISVFGSGDEILAICGNASAPFAMGIFKYARIGVVETFQPAQGPLSAWVHRPELRYEDLLPGLIKALPGKPLVVGVTQRDPDIDDRPADSPRLRTLDYVSTARILVNRTFDEYWRSRDKKVRYEIQRRLKRLVEIGIYPRLEVTRDTGGVAAAIEDYGRIESVGWKGKAGTAVSHDNLQGLFYRSILREYCARGVGSIYRYYFGDQIVAMQLCIENADTLVFLKITYDETYRRYGPGILMKHAIYEQVFREARLKKIEFYGPHIPSQAHWNDEVRTLYHINFYRWPWLPAMRGAFLRPHRKSTLVTAHSEDKQIASDVAQAGGRSQTRGVAVYAALSALPPHCATLFTPAGKTSLFYTMPWYRNFIQSVLAANERLRIYAVCTEPNQPAARALLLMSYQDGGTGLARTRILRGLANYYTSLFGPLLGEDASDAQGTLDTLAAAIAHDEIRWDEIDLHPLPADAPFFPGLIKAFRKAGFLTHAYFCFGNWYLQVRGRSYAEYFESMPSQLKSTIVRKTKQFEKYANSKIVIFRDEAGLEQALRAYEQIYSASWKIPEPYPEFIRGLCRTCAGAGWLRLGVAYIDDQPAAAQIWIVNDGTANIYKLAYDERFARFSLGTILTAHLMQHVIDVDKVSIVDYLTGDDAYKRDWMSDRRERWGIVAFNPRTPRGAFAAMRHLCARAAKRVINAISRRSRIRH